MPLRHPTLSSSPDAPVRQQYGEVLPIHRAVFVEVAELKDEDSRVEERGFGGKLGVGFGEEQLARWTFRRDGVGAARGDLCDDSEARGDIALAGVIPSPSRDRAMVHTGHIAA